MTNEELYRKAVAMLHHRAEEETRSLAEWLGALLGGLRAFAGQPGLDAQQFFELLDAAFVAEVADVTAVERYHGWEPTLFTDVVGLAARQIDDLRAMEAEGTLAGGPDLLRC